LNAKGINVHVSNNKVTLTGTVGSWYQKDEAARIAWSASGIWIIDNEPECEYKLID